MFRVLFALMCVLALANCARNQDGDRFPGTEISLKERKQLVAENTVKVNKAATGCNASEKVYADDQPFSFDIAEDVAENGQYGVEIVLIDLCMEEGLAVIAADAACDESMAGLIPMEFGRYAYNPAFVAARTERQLLQFNTCLREQLGMDGAAAS